MAIPYFDEAGQEIAVHYRLQMGKTAEADDRFKWRRGSKPTLYGLWRLRRAREAGSVVLVEGPSDCHTLWSHGIRAIGTPGGAMWDQKWTPYLDDIATIYVVIEPDQGGETLHERVSADSAIRERVRFVRLDGAKDPSDLYLQDPEHFAERFEAALAAAVPWADEARQKAAAQRQAAWEASEPAARRPRVLERVAEAVGACGVVGEARVVKLLYLALTSRLLERPVSLVLKGPSSAGKSYIAQRVLKFFPPEAMYVLSAMSERALAYSEEPLQHRFLVIYEAAGLASDFASYLVRSLLSEGRVRYETVEKTSEGLHARLIEREGPTGLLVTTTAIKLHPENETRLLSVPINDTPDQTRAVIDTLGADRDDGAVDLAPWHAWQTWLTLAEHRVAIPYAQVLAGLVPPAAVRLRRDFGAVLNLIRAHAMLHQPIRERDGQGRVVADIDDYAVVRGLVADLVAEGVEAGVPGGVREVVQAVRVLTQMKGAAAVKANDAVIPGDATVSLTDIAGHLQIDRMSASRRVRVALDRGYLANLEKTRGRPFRLVVDHPLPDEQIILPTVERLKEALAARGVPPGATPACPALLPAPAVRQTSDL